MDDYDAYPAPAASARVLEIACAGGGNLIPMAYRLPRAGFLGVDLSARQIEAGRRLIDQLGLPNIELRQGDIMDLDVRLGEFDYIIAHGVYSWVPAPVRESLLRLAAALLSPAGLFYVSFNTLPGWRMRGMLRDVLRYAVRGADGPEARIAAARAALVRLEAAIAGFDALSARYLREEIAQLKRSHPSYLLFEYLAEHNRAFLFSDFVADTERAGLRYLCDTDLRTLFPSSYGAGVERALAPIEDGVELEQWLDFATSRNFRQSVLCRADAELPEDIAIDLDQFAPLAFRADLKPLDKPRLKQVQATAFTSPTGARLTVSQPLTKSIVLQLSERYPDCLPLAEVMPAAMRQVAAAGGSPERDINTCLEELFSLFAHGGIGVQTTPQSFPPPAMDRPRVVSLALAQLETGHEQVTTAHHGNLDVDPFAARLMRYLDGSRTLEEVSQALADDLTTGRLHPPPNVSPGKWTREKLLARVRGAVAELVALFARQGVLTPARTTKQAAAD
jgi:methyltransferase-like protein/trans-aconitate methyltransferase